MADEVKVERTIAILGRLLRGDKKLQVEIPIYWSPFLNMIGLAGSLPHAIHDDPLPSGAKWNQGTSEVYNCDYMHRISLLDICTVQHAGAHLRSFGHKHSISYWQGRPHTDQRSRKAVPNDLPLPLQCEVQPFLDNLPQMGAKERFKTKLAIALNNRVIQKVKRLWNFFWCSCSKGIGNEGCLGQLWWTWML